MPKPTPASLTKKWPPRYDRVRPALSSALAAHAKAVLAEDSYELAPKEALSWAISDHPPHSVLGGEGGVACLAALRAALLDFHRAVKSIRYNKGKAAAESSCLEVRAAHRLPRLGGTVARLRSLCTTYQALYKTYYAMRLCLCLLACAVI